MTQVITRRGADRVLVFCNKIDTCRRVENHLKRSVVKGMHHKVRPRRNAVPVPVPLPVWPPTPRGHNADPKPAVVLWLDLSESLHPAVPTRAPEPYALPALPPPLFDR
jgi:hypothetical protein